jgi:hypothetical protein
MKRVSDFISRARNRLGTQFLEALEADFNKFGPQAIALVREKKPETALDELVEKDLIRDGQLTEAGWRELREADHDRERD